MNRECVGGVSGVCHPLPWRDFMFASILFAAANKSLFTVVFCLKGGSFKRINGIENMNVFRQDSETVLFIRKSFGGRPLPHPSTIFLAILHATKAGLVTFHRQSLIVIS